MLLSKLLERCDVASISGETDIQIDQIKINSKDVNEGDCFICLVGSRSDGHNFANEAIARGRAQLYAVTITPIRLLLL